MSELRNQLDMLRDAYRSTRYPGSLAADIARRPAQARRWTVGRIAAAASAFAAIAAVIVWSAYIPMSHPGGGDGGDVAIVSADPEFAVIPEFPSDLPLVPEAASLHDIGGMPVMPSMNFSFTESPEPEPSEDLS